MSKTVAMLLASAGSGIAAGATGMYLYLWDRGKEGPAQHDVKKDDMLVSTPRSLPLPQPAQEDHGEAPASAFIMPFVKRYGYPDLDQVILPSEEYTSCWDSRTRNARWVVERINLNTVSGPGDRKKSPFRPDSRLQPLFRSSLSDFYGSGYDRGHLAPAGDHKTTQANLTQTFLLSNMAPQVPSFNRGYWGDFEEFVRTLVVPSKRSIEAAAAAGFSTSSSLSPPFKDVYVITGPLFLPSKETASTAGTGNAVDIDQGQAEGAAMDVPSQSSRTPAATKWVVKHDILGNPMQMVAVPTHFFKIIVAEPYPPPPSEALVSKPTTFVAAFAMPNADIPNNTDLRNFLVPLEALSSVSGMRFFGTGLLDEIAKLSLDKEAIEVRERAGVPALSGDWGTGIEKTNRREKNGKDNQSLSTADRPRVFRHLCTTTSCRGL
ncbi:unnamed protein product [Ectocarpus sp. 4 AP-2014]